MTEIPTIRPHQVVLHILPDPTFVRRFGARVKAAGGRYSDVRGNRAPDRYVTLPDGHPGLVDEIANAFPRPKLLITLDKWTAEGFDEGYDQRLAFAFSHAENKVIRWIRSEGLSASQAIDAKAFEVSAAFDWGGFLAGWNMQNDAEAARRRDAGLKVEMADTLREIGAESLRILDGANDIDPLKELAERYRSILQALGLEDPGRPMVPGP